MSKVDDGTDRDRDRDDPTDRTKGENLLIFPFLPSLPNTMICSRKETEVENSQHNYKMSFQ